MNNNRKDKPEGNLYITIVEDEPVVARGLLKYFDLQGFQTEWVDNGLDAVSQITSHQPDIVLLDLKLPGLDGLAVLQQIKERMEVMPAVIVVTGHGELDDAITAFRLGAYDFFRKPASLSEIDAVIRRTEIFVNLSRKYQKASSQLQYLQKEIRSKPATELVGVSSHLQQLRNTIAIVANTADTSVLITGESGTGKEVVARLIHESSRRSAKNFVAVNCSALTESLFESELFGHVKGSFTGAVANRTGYFEYADEGTILLDEIGELSPAIQAKLLRVLETRTFSKVGSTREQSVNVRIIAATNQNLEAMLEKGTFRSDLFYRLNTFHLVLQPLRNRIDDIAPLADFFIRKFATLHGYKIPAISPDVYSYLMSLPLKGNVRELRNLTERACIVSQGATLRPPHFQIQNIGNTVPDADPGNLLSLEFVEKRTIMTALALCAYRRAATARMLEITPQSFDRKLIKHQLTHLVKNPIPD